MKNVTNEPVAFVTSADNGEVDIAEIEGRLSKLKVGAMLYAAPTILEGYRLVPVEPTVEMKIAGDNAGFWCGDKYKAMLAAAPKQGEQS